MTREKRAGSLSYSEGGGILFCESVHRALGPTLTRYEWPNLRDDAIERQILPPIVRHEPSMVAQGLLIGAVRRRAWTLRPEPVGSATFHPLLASVAGVADSSLVRLVSSVRDALVRRLIVIGWPLIKERGGPGPPPSPKKKEITWQVGGKI